MMETLNLADRLLALGILYRELGRPQDAHDVLTRLLNFRTLSPDIACLAQVTLAELHLKVRRFKKARRHLAAALQVDGNNARLHYLMATACREDDMGNLRRAIVYFARSLELDPSDVRCRGEYGLTLLHLGRTDEGLEHLTRAHAEAPHDLEALDRRLRGLRRAGRLDEAQELLRQNRFRFPRHPRFEKLVRDFQFQILRQEQEFARLQSEPMSDGTAPVLLPFVRHEAHDRLPRPAYFRRASIRKLRRNEDRVDPNTQTEREGS